MHIHKINRTKKACKNRYKNVKFQMHALFLHVFFRMLIRIQQEIIKKEEKRGFFPSWYASTCFIYYMYHINIIFYIYYIYIIIIIFLQKHNN